MFSGGYKSFIDKAHVLNKSQIVLDVPTKNYTIVFSSDSKEEAEYFLSWINTKFVRYLILLGCCGYSNAFRDVVWRFVPDPGPFDHIFTDEELYTKYNLSDDQIKVIESVIKSR